MNRTIKSVETDSNNFNLEINQENLSMNKKISTTDAITSAAYTIAKNAEAKAIVTFSVSGITTMKCLEKELQY